MLVVVASLIVTVSAVPAYADQERIDKLQKQIQKHEDRILVLEDKKNSPNPAANLDERIQRLVDKIADKQAIIERLTDTITDAAIVEGPIITESPTTTTEPLITEPTPTPFDVSTASFVDSFSIPIRDTHPHGIAFSTDGTKMFVVDNNDQDVQEYVLSTPFDVSTAVFADYFSVASQIKSATGIAFSTDGAKMFVVDEGRHSTDIHEYVLFTPFDVSTAEYTHGFNVSSQMESAHGLAFSADGTKMFVVSNDGYAVDHYDLLTPFDVSTGVYNANFLTRSQTMTPSGLAFSADGTKMFVVDILGQDVHEYTLSTPFIIPNRHAPPSTIEHTHTYSVRSQTMTPSGLAFSADGTKMFVVDEIGSKIHEYVLSSVSPDLTELEMIHRIQYLESVIHEMAVQMNEMNSHIAEMHSDLMATITPRHP